MTQREIISSFILIALICIGLCLNQHFRTIAQKEKYTPDSLFLAEISRIDVAMQQYDSLHTWHAPKEWTAYYPKYEDRPHDRFPFDPNHVDSISLLRMGYSPNQVRGIMNYRRKGGIYRTAEDFNKFKWLPEEDFKTMIPFIRIDSADFKKNYTTTASIYPQKTDTIIELNTADTASLQRIRGIGSGYAKMIVNYRERLGGYTSVNQLKEIEYLPETTYETIKNSFIVDPNKVKRIDVNRASVGTLRRHPYISFELAKSIYTLRRSKVTLHNIEELKEIPGFTDEMMEKLHPYLQF